MRHCKGNIRDRGCGGYGSTYLTNRAVLAMTECRGVGVEGYNCVVLLGPTAVGKTAIGVRIALETGGEIISADSRQVYRGLDISSGKDLQEYKGKGSSGEEWSVAHHLIDICDIKQEYSVFDYQRDFYAAFNEVKGRALPVIVGGTGMYLDAVLRGYAFVPVPKNSAFRAKAEGMSLEELGSVLLKIRGDVHGGEDLRDRERCIRAIEIALYMKSEEGIAAQEGLKVRDIRPLVLGTTLPRQEVWDNIRRRLDSRLNNGMIEEIDGLHSAGVSWERLEGLGLECKYVSQYIQGKIKTLDALKELLFIAIRQFAKRQETWFRGMERKGVAINWLPPASTEDRVSSALAVMQTGLLCSSRLCYLFP